MAVSVPFEVEGLKDQRLFIDLVLFCSTELKCNPQDEQKSDNFVTKPTKFVKYTVFFSLYKP